MRRAKRSCTAAAAAVALFAVSGCGGDDDYANLERPPSPILITGLIGQDEVSISPNEFGAGPIELVLTNQTGATHQITLETAGRSAGIRQSTGPINPSETARLKVNVEPGEYEVAVDGSDIDAATLKVGPQRESAQNELLQP